MNPSADTEPSRQKTVVNYEANPPRCSNCKNYQPAPARIEKDVPIKFGPAWCWLNDFKVRAVGLCDGWEGVHEQPDQTNRRLSADARRYRWLREQQWDTANLFVISGSQSAVRLGTDCPSYDRLDAAIDAAMSADQPEVP